MKKLLGCVLSAAVIAVPTIDSASAASTQRRHLPISSTLRAHWGMNENPITADENVSESVGGLSGETSSNWSGSHADPLAAVGSGSFYFPGWNDGVLDATVDPTASSFSIPDSPDLNPDSSDFAVQIYVKALDPSADPAITSSDSLNIVQKGLAGSTRQQWKISVLPDGRFQCTFRGADASGGMQEVNATSTTEYLFDVTSHVTCRFSPSTGVATITVDSEGQSQSSSAPDNPVPFTITNASPVTVGKKPGTFNAGDTFAGWLDNLDISKG
jgi:hypothetical protein